MFAAIIGAALAVGSAVYGAVKSSKQSEKAKKELEQQEIKDEAWYMRKSNEDYADTAAGQRLITQAKDYAKQVSKKAEGQAAVTGASDASVAMAKDQGNKMVGNTLSSIAANDTARKDAADSQYQNMRKAISNQKIANYNQQAANISAAASQASNALLQSGLAVEGMSGAGSTSNSTPTTKASSMGVHYDYDTSNIVGNTPSTGSEAWWQSWSKLKG